MGLVTHAQTAINRDDSARNVASLIGCKPANHASDLFRLRETTSRDGRQVVLLGLFGQNLGHCGVNEARCHHVSGDVAAAQLAGDGACHTDQCSLGCGVVDLAGGTIQTHHGGHQDDAAALELQHALDGALNHAERTGEVGVDHVGEVGFLHAHQQHVAGDTCVGDQHLHGTEFCFNFLECFVNAVGIAYICLDGEKFFGGFTATVGDADIVSCCLEFLGNFVADASVAAGDQHGLGSVLAHELP
ncbi:hypothetical protein RMDY18_10760 [Rothia mucilaginosa DY-18]|uniref:Uncharacterized protein n=1 Tax=Rothia mucilaginosa (strain DY-18) TaxID=680646 RepID=D2NTD2_ROTMD|nr:hypothetical protein RMDY18_10760 [Rothia mucilaginosa DY-18]